MCIDSKYAFFRACLTFAGLTIISSLHAAPSFWVDSNERNLFSGVVFAYELPDFGQDGYREGVKWMFSAFEKRTAKKLAPGEKHKVGIKIYTSSGDGIQTPPFLVRAVIDELKSRGYSEKDIFIVDATENKLRDSGYLPPLSARTEDLFEGVQVRCLDSGRWWNKTWFYENPLPVSYTSEIGRDMLEKQDVAANEEYRKSYLPAALIEDVDFWINLPSVMDNATIEISGSLANATLWNISNRERFFGSPANAPVAMAEIAAIPEFLDSWALTIVSMERFQIVGGPIFNSNYVRSDPLLLASSDPAVLDAWAAKRINAYRRIMGFKPINSPPYAVSFARLVNVGSSDSENIRWETPEGKPVPTVAADPDKVKNAVLSKPRRDTGRIIPIVPESVKRRQADDKDD
jgi:hypothetical protein